MSRTRYFAQRVLPGLVSVAVLGALFTRVDAAALIEPLTWRVAITLGVALVIYGAVTLALEALSIVRLIRPEPGRFGVIVAARVKCASYLLGIVNYALGAAALSWLLRKRAGIGLGESASVVLLIVSVDLVLLLTLAGVGASLTASDAPAIQASFVATALVAFFLGITIVRLPVSLGPLERIRTLAIFEALRVTSVRRLAELAVLRLAFTSSFIALGGAAFYGFDILPSASQLIVGMVFVGVVSALPLAIAGLGTGQVAVLIYFRDLAPEETLLALSLVLSAGMITLRVLMGLVFAREFTREALEETRRTET